MAMLCARHGENGPRRGVTAGMGRRSSIRSIHRRSAAVMLMLWLTPGVVLVQASDGTGAPAPIGRDDPSAVPPSRELPVLATWAEQVEPRRGVPPIFPVGVLCR